MKQVVALSLDGVLFRHEPFREAHEEWFRLMSSLLDDPQVAQYAFADEYFDKVDEVMQRYLGTIKEEDQTAFARDLYAMCLVARTRKRHLVLAAQAAIKELKEKYVMVAITSSPERAVLPMLEKTGCKELFDGIIASPHSDRPSKEDLFKRCEQQFGKPTWYLGWGKKSLSLAKKLGIQTVGIGWVDGPEGVGDRQVSSVEELNFFG